MASDPARVVHMLSAHWVSYALAAAIEVDLFTALGRRHLTATELARRCSARPSRIARLSDYLVNAGLLQKRAGRYRASVDAAKYLNRNSPDAITEAMHFFRAPVLLNAFSRLGTLVRRRRIGRLAPSDEDVFWRTFAHRTLPLRRIYAREIAGELERRRLVGDAILEIGAGASPLGIDLLARRKTARLTAQDRAGVVAAARVHARAAGVSPRVRILPGDLRTVDLGGPFDLVLAINVLDYVEVPSRIRLLRRVHGALRPGGVLVVGAPLLDPSRTSPPDAVAYDLLLLALGMEGRPATAHEIARQLRRASFSRVVRPRGGSLMLAWKALNA